MCVKDNAEYEATGMLNTYPRCVLRRLTMPSMHTFGCISDSFVGITLFVNTQGCGKPQIADEQEADTHVFRCVVTRS